MNIETIIVALIALSSAPLMAWLSNRSRRLEKKEDYARQDQLTARTEVAAANVARLLVTSNAAVAVTTKETNSKLDVIHSLVNSTLSAAKISELNAFIALLALMQNPVIVDLETIQATEAKIAELRSLITERESQAAEIKLAKNTV